MAYLSDIEIAQQAEMEPITEVAKRLDIDADDLELYGKYKAKVSFDLWEKVKDNEDGKLILVTAITPTPAGEGKTTTSVGLAQALAKLGKKVTLALREPSLGPVFGVKGGAAGGGYSQVVPMEDINIHFTGDFHAITSAHNLLAAMLDNSVQQGNPLNIDPRRIVFKRVLDMNEPRAPQHSHRPSAARSTACRARTASTSQSPPRSWRYSASRRASKTSKSASRTSSSPTPTKTSPSPRATSKRRARWRCSSRTRSSRTSSRPSSTSRLSSTAAPSPT